MRKSVGSHALFRVEQPRRSVVQAARWEKQGLEERQRLEARWMIH